MPAIRNRETGKVYSDQRAIYPALVGHPDWEVIFTDEEVADVFDQAAADNEAPEPAEVILGHQFDPAEHTVTEVLDHLAQVDPTEHARIIAAETAGQARKGIVARS